MNSLRVDLIVVAGIFAMMSNVAAEVRTYDAALRYERFDFPFGGGSVQLVIFDSAQYTLRVIDNGPRATRPKFASLQDAMQRNGAVAGINGGFFDTERFTPSGMMIAGGRTITPFDSNGWQGGVLAVRKAGILLTDRDAFSKQDGVTEGLQSGPWLVRGRKIDAKQKEDLRRARRVFVGTSKSGLCAIGFATPVTFYDLAEFLVSESVTRNIELSNVLALDGASSAGFWCNVEGKQMSEPELVTVRNFVAVVPVGAPVFDDPLMEHGKRMLIVLFTLLVVFGVGRALLRRRQ